MRSISIKYIMPLIVGMILLSTACSTTKRLAEGDVLYTGVKEMKIASADGGKIAPEVNSEVKDALSVEPNNALFSSNSIKFLPIELWAWNYLYTPNEKSIKGWLYGIFAAEPVLIQTVRPDLRVNMAKDILDIFIILTKSLLAQSQTLQFQRIRKVECLKLEEIINQIPTYSTQDH